MTLSTMEAKYIDATHAANELIWFQHLVDKVFRPLSHPIILHLHNQSAITLANSEGQFHACMKHIDIHYHFIKFAIQNETITLLYCPTKNMIVDILTKSVLLIKHKYLTHSLGLVPI